MARSPSTMPRELLFTKLHQFDQPGLFGLNYQLPEYLRSNRLCCINM